MSPQEASESPEAFVVRFPLSMPTEDVLRLALASGLSVTPEQVWAVRFRMRKELIDAQLELESSRAVAVAVTPVAETEPPGLPPKPFPEPPGPCDVAPFPRTLFDVGPPKVPPKPTPTGETIRQVIFSMPPDMPTVDVVHEVRQRTGRHIKRDYVRKVRSELRDHHAVAVAQPPAPTVPDGPIPSYRDVVRWYPDDADPETLQAAILHHTGKLLTKHKIAQARHYVRASRHMTKKPVHAYKAEFIRSMPASMPPAEVVAAGRKAGWGNITLSDVYASRAQDKKRKGPVKFGRPRKNPDDLPKDPTLSASERKAYREQVVAEPLAVVSPGTERSAMRSALKKLVLQMGVAEVQAVMAEVNKLLGEVE